MGSRRALGFGFAASVAVLATATVAFACTSFEGKVIVRATQPGTGATSTASADGNGGLHGFCPAPTADPGVSEIVYPSQGMFRNTTFTVQVGTSTMCVGGQTTAADTTYDVRWLNLTANLNALKDVGATCMNNNYSPVVVGAITVSGGTAGPTSFNQQASAAGDRVNVCVTNSAGPRPGSTGSAPPEVKLFMI